MKPSFAIVGCGRVGKALGKHLQSVGYSLTGISTQSMDSAEKAASIIGTKNFTSHSWEITKNADIVFITTPDGVIADVCTQLAKNKGFKSDAVVLHCSGAHPSTILSSALECGTNIGSMHPLQSFSAESSGNTFEGIVISVEGDEKAVTVATQISNDLGSNCLTIKTDSKILYHAAAVVACNYLVALQDAAFKLMEKAGISKDDVFAVLSPLISGTLSNIEKSGTIKSLTGPIARGDIETITRHINGINDKAPEILSLYNALGLYTIGLAKAGGTITDIKAQELNNLLGQTK
ncbi:MAG: DUF2520 domain-containing protein [Deltaproteobacteria bacterium]|nr:DUF2520 domain-containing protein [Deltaproteobacteria bacterium]MBW1848578.1 DUF2520 domain-containing protein [Deltaproteobacteria bacterium]MBW2180420.1 DUF2520 domain-containing protein [Deltaproteobacteria bacterium]MBW2364102.1 DUF2520 domain-containing protein [Deltaproteobacteria bacterium]